MTLRPIVAALGGELYNGGARANVPAPGHSASDRSVSLLLSEGRVVIHGFGGSDWRIFRDALVTRGLIDQRGRLTGSDRCQPSLPKPTRDERVTTAVRLWEGAALLGTDTASARHLRHRAVRCGACPPNLRHHAGAPTSVYRLGSHKRPALVARISDAQDQVSAVELTYLQPNGCLASGMNLVRKTVGVVPAGSAVRFAEVAEEMLVAEGVVTTLSAIDRFKLPGWALMAANNLAAWSPPPGVRRVLIAADRGATGQTAALPLRRRLISVGVKADAVWPPPPFGDWNDVEAHVTTQREKEGR